MANLNQKALNQYDTFNPVRNLWRNVLIVAIEDVIKKTTVSARFKNYYSHAQQTALEYFAIPNQDFYDVCQFAELDHTQVRRNVIERVKQIQLKEGLNGKSYMPILQGERLQKNPY
jgi:hypothetical protein